MKKLVIAVSIALLSACAAPQKEQISLMPQATLSQSDIVRGTNFTLTSKDIRAAQYVALLDNGRENIQPIHAKENMRIALESILTKQFNSQGFNITLDSNNSINLEIQEALVNVQHSVMENEIDGKVTLEITAENPQGKLTKTYHGVAKRTGMMSASNDDIQLVLNDVLTLVLAEIANDTELQNYMKERF
ncbi:hypothetical protein BCU68_05560 [Vibrio sp. 10N.286.49.B3]|uniref:YajG family lipoprotein n=1 Tax=Vibrio sp. 10N.286.49.B3 TaxID=1880855 RepID=UPI000C8470F1|nr:YajG family lipoprotein [Vibrio sp. 10N.286.49.B3]PMH41148.1 hypothetical protein BCU68_05560 [Vibrio sp. 10N.286.49.B3]